MADEKKKDAEKEGKEEAKEEGKEEGKGKEEKGEKKEGEAGAEGAEGAAGEAGAEGGDSKKSKKKMIILIVVAIVVVLGIAVPAVLYITGFFNKKPVVTEQSGEAGGKGEPVVGPDGVVEQPVFYDMAEFIVNLNVGSKRPSFLKMTVSLEIPGESQVPRIEEKMPRIRDSFQVYLRELRQEDLQGSAGLYRLREELLLRINKVVYPAKVNDILFKEILVQ